MESTANRENLPPDPLFDSAMIKSRAFFSGLAKKHVQEIIFPITPKFPSLQSLIH